MKMEKTHTRRYPLKEEKQLDIYEALTCMLNCRRNLLKNGFEELILNVYGRKEEIDKRLFFGEFVFANGFIFRGDEILDSGYRSEGHGGNLERIFEKVINERAIFRSQQGPKLKEEIMATTLKSFKEFAQLFIKTDPSIKNLLNTFAFKKWFPFAATRSKKPVVGTKKDGFYFSYSITFD